MVAIVGPASRHERAFVGLVTMQPDCYVGQRARQHLELRVDFPADLVQQRFDRCRHIRMLEERLEIGEMTLPVQMHDVRACDRNTALFEDMQLHRDIGEMLLFLGVCRLHLREMEAIPVRPEDVDGHERVIREETRLENRGRTVIDQLARALHPLVHRGVRQIDQYTARKPLTRKGADLRPLVEAVLEHLVGLELDGLGLVDFPPQELVALDTGGVAGLRKAMRHDSNLLYFFISRKRARLGALEKREKGGQPPQRGAASATAAGTGLRWFCASTALNVASAPPLIPVHVVTALARSLHAAAYSACIASVGARSPVSSPFSWRPSVPFTPANVGGGGPPGRNPPPPPRLPAGSPPTAASVESRAFAAVTTAAGSAVAVSASTTLRAAATC